METYLHEIVTAHRSVNKEIEARLGTLTNNGFVPGVDKDAFYHVKEVLDASRAFDRTYVTNTKDVFVGDFRNHHDERTGEVTCIKKTRISFRDFDTVRVAVYHEVPCAPVKESSTSFVRYKTRWSYVHGIWHYDLTHVSSGNNDTYEIELELCTIGALAYSASHVVRSFVSKIHQLNQLVRRCPSDGGSPLL